MDKVSDLLTRIKNGYLASKREIEAPYSKLNLAIVELLKNEGYIESFSKVENMLKLKLRYEDRQPILRDVKRISKPGRRVYSGSQNLPRVLNGLGIAIISTPEGVMTDNKPELKA